MSSFAKSITRLSWLLPASVLLLSACSDSADTSAKETVSIAHQQGSTNVPVLPENLVVLDMSTLDAMTLFDYPIAGVPKGISYPEHMAHYGSNDYFDAGTVFEPSFERISAEAPELIITGGRARDAYPELSRIAPTLDLSLEFGNISDSLQNQLNTLGQILDKEEEAVAIFEDFRQRIEHVQELSADQGTALVAMVVGGRLSAYGAGSRFGFIYDELGFEPALELEDRGTHGNPMSFELLLRADPDWLFVFSRDQAIGQDGAQSAVQVLNNDLVHRTKASQNDQVVFLDSSAIYIAGGVGAYYRLIDQVEEAINAKQ